MFVIDRRDAGCHGGIYDPTKWHAVHIWLPRFVLAEIGGKQRWTFVWFGKIFRKSIASEPIGRRLVHRWLYRAESALA